MNAGDKPTKIEVRGARVHNLKNINVDIPLNGIVGIAAYPAPEKAHWRWAYYMPRARADILNRCPPTQGGA